MLFLRRHGRSHAERELFGGIQFLAFGTECRKVCSKFRTDTGKVGSRFLDIFFDDRNGQIFALE